MSNTPPFPKDDHYSLPGAADLKDPVRSPGLADGGFDARHQTQAPTQGAGAGIKQIVEDVRETFESVRPRLARASRQAGEDLAKTFEKARCAASSDLDCLSGYVKTKPLQSVFIAISAGIVAGIALRRI